MHFFGFLTLGVLGVLLFGSRQVLKRLAIMVAVPIVILVIVILIALANHQSDEFDKVHAHAAWHQSEK